MDTCILMSQLAILHRSADACPDCPATRQQAFPTLASSRASCAFQCASVSARAPIPSRWSDDYELALVRRGILIRQRIDPSGGVTSVDAVGPGCLLRLPGGEASATGYAASDALVCLLPHDILARAEEAPWDLVRLQQQSIERMERFADARGRTSAESKVAALLSTLADSVAPCRDGDAVPSGIQQRDMAELVSLRHETVCRALRALEERGAIDRGRDQIRIVDRAMLASI